MNTLNSDISNQSAPLYRRLHGDTDFHTVINWNIYIKVRFSTPGASFSNKNLRSTSDLKHDKEIFAKMIYLVNLSHFLD